MTGGFLVIDKPSGITSNQAVTRVRKATGVRKVGHAGTLDPMATGVLVLAVGKVTRLIRYLQDLPKEYGATAQFGVATDTLDAHGAILSREPMELDVAEVEAAAERFVGTIRQVPPMVSALKHEGRRLYELAREGEVVERAARPVIIHELEIITIGPGPYPLVEFRVVCGKGTYVRSLADDLAGVFGGAAHLTELRRTRIGSLAVSEALPLDELDDWEGHLLTPVQALADLPTMTVDPDTAMGVGHGMRFVGGKMLEAPENLSFKVVNGDGQLLAIYRRIGEQAQPE
ncbi:MAG: tRNA pseudouridine(55) synthase TruB, partial [Acidimicrobiia bacterium]